MNGPCMCGDIQCPSCGPAQGNSRCPLCRAWFDEGCVHIGEDGELKPEFQAEADAAAQADAEADNKYAKDLEDEERLAEEYWRSQR